LHRVTVDQTSNAGLALNNVPEKVKHPADQRLQGGNFAELSQVSRETLRLVQRSFLNGVSGGKPWVEVSGGQSEIKRGDGENIRKRSTTLKIGDAFIDLALVPGD
jgi:hypothetical protein